MTVTGTSKKRAGEILALGADTYVKRNAMYGNNYKEFGPIMLALFQGSVPELCTPGDVNRMGVFVQCLSKLTRYAAGWKNGGHRDSAHDLMVYAAMLEELTDE